MGWLKLELVWPRCIWPGIGTVKVRSQISYRIQHRKALQWSWLYFDSYPSTSRWCVWNRDSMVETRKEHIARKPPRDSDPISFLFAHFLPMSNGPVLHTQSRAGQSSACTLIQWYNFPLYLRIVHFIYIEQVKAKSSSS